MEGPNMEGEKRRARPHDDKPNVLVCSDGRQILVWHMDECLILIRCNEQRQKLLDMLERNTPKDKYMMNLVNFRNRMTKM